MSGVTEFVSSLKLVWLLAIKDLRSEYRSRQAFITTLFFAFLILVIFHFAFDPGDKGVETAGPGILWVSLLFPGVIQLNRSFQAEMEEGTYYGLILAPVDGGTLFLGKFTANWLFLFVIDLLILLAFLILFNVPFHTGLGWLVLIVMLGGVTFNAVGTLFAAMVSTIRTRDVLLPILLFPILIPVIIAGVNATREILGGGEADFFQVWLRLLSGCGVIYTAAAYLAFEHVVGE